MSDRELVSFDPAQFAKLEALLGNIATILDNKLAHIERTLNEGLKALATGGGSSDNSQVLTAIKALDDKIDALALAIKEDNSAEVQRQIDQFTSQLNTSTAELKGEIDQHTKEK